jgi:hypothetical protein
MEVTTATVFSLNFCQMVLPLLFSYVLLLRALQQTSWTNASLSLKCLFPREPTKKLGARSCFKEPNPKNGILKLDPVLTGKREAIMWHTEYRWHSIAAHLSQVVNWNETLGRTYVMYAISDSKQFMRSSIYKGNEIGTFLSNAIFVL